MDSLRIYEPAGKGDMLPRGLMQLPIRRLRRVLRTYRGRRVSVSVPLTDGHFMVVRVSRRALLAAAMRARRRGVKTLPVLDLAGSLAIG